jgi:hypothetical protein
MIKHYNKNKSPFRIGQLVKRDIGPFEGFLYLVIKIKWSEHRGKWTMLLLSQRSGQKLWRASDYFRAAEETDEQA